MAFKMRSRKEKNQTLETMSLLESERHICTGHLGYRRNEMRSATAIAFFWVQASSGPGIHAPNQESPSNLHLSHFGQGDAQSLLFHLIRDSAALTSKIVRSLKHIPTMSTDPVTKVATK